MGERIQCAVEPFRRSWAKIVYTAVLLHAHPAEPEAISLGQVEYLVHICVVRTTQLSQIKKSTEIVFSSCTHLICFYASTRPSRRKSRGSFFEPRRDFYPPTRPSPQKLPRFFLRLRRETRRTFFPAFTTIFGAVATYSCTILCTSSTWAEEDTCR